MTMSGDAVVPLRGWLVTGKPIELYSAVDAVRRIFPRKLSAVNLFLKLFSMSSMWDEMALDTGFIYIKSV